MMLSRQRLERIGVSGSQFLIKPAPTKCHIRKLLSCLTRSTDVGPWWQQMVTVTYEQARGLRQKHEKPGGYEISVSRTVNAPARVFIKSRKRKESESVAVGRCSDDKEDTQQVNAHGWKDGKTSLQISFLEKGDGKSQVVVQHGKLPDRKPPQR